MAVSFVMFVIASLFKVSVGLVFGLALLLVTLMIMSRQLKKQSIMIERKFLQNLRYRDMRAEYMGEKKPEYAGRLLSRDIHLTDFEIPGESEWVGRTLSDLNFGKKYGVHIVSILRGKRRINIPRASERIFPKDKIQVIATDEELNNFGKDLERANSMDTNVIEKSEMTLKQLLIDSDSEFLGMTMEESGIRDKYRCLVVGIEHAEDELHAPGPHEKFEENDILWVVGEKEDVYHLVELVGVRGVSR